MNIKERTKLQNDILANGLMMDPINIERVDNRRGTDWVSVFRTDHLYTRRTDQDTYAVWSDTFEDAEHDTYSTIGMAVDRLLQKYGKTVSAGDYATWTDSLEDEKEFVYPTPGYGVEHLVWMQVEEVLRKHNFITAHLEQFRGRKND